MINDPFDEKKEMYFAKAQSKTGVISSIVKALNDFVKEYDSANNTMKDERKKLRETYVFNSALYNQKELEIYNTFNETIASVREDHKKMIHDAVQTVKDKVAEIISAKMPEGAMDDVTLIQNFAGRLSDDEIKVFLNKYDKCYLVTKVIFCAMAKEQAERLGVKFISADDILSTIDKIEATAIDMIRKYNGAVSYNVALMLDGENIQTVNDSFESFVSAYKV